MLFFRREMQQKTDRPVIPPHPDTNMCTTQKKDRKQRKSLLAVFLWSKCGDSNSVPLGPKRTYKGNFR